MWPTLHLILVLLFTASAVRLLYQCFTYSGFHSGCSSSCDISDELETCTFDILQEKKEVRETSCAPPPSEEEKQKVEAEGPEEAAVGFFHNPNHLYHCFLPVRDL